MIEEKTSYKQIFKATTLFGGVQVLKIVFSIIKSKVAAVLIGSVGFGILGVLNASINLISGITKMGLDVSSIREIAANNKDEDSFKVLKTIFIFKRIIKFTAIAGALLTLILSSWLSTIAFGSKEYTWAFLWLSIAVIFNQLAVAEFSILQGKRKLKKLAKANLVSSFAVLILAILFYYFFGVNGIVPVIVSSSIVIFLVAFFYNKNDPSKRETKDFAFSIKEAKPLITLGLTLSVTTIISLLVTYFLQVYITNNGGLEEVGLYNAAFIFLNTYVGLVFTAMSKDYFPRLSSKSNDNVASMKVINEQALIAVLLLTPIIVVFLTFATFIIKLLYSSEFLAIESLLSLGIVALFFKAVSWSMGYYIIAKGNAKVFITTSIIFNSIYTLILVFSYNNFGLTGIGYALIAYYIIHLLGIFIVVNNLYDFNFKRDFLRIFSVCLVFAVSALLTKMFLGKSYRMYVLLILLTLSCLYVYKQLDKRVSVRNFITEILKKKNEKH